MSEELNQAVPETQASEAVPPVRAVDSGDPELLQRKLDLIKQDNKAKGESNKALKQQLEDMQRQLAERKQAELIEKEDYKGLHADLKNNFDSVVAERDALQQQLEQVKVDRQQDQIKAASLAAISQSGAVNPNQVYALLKQDLRLKDDGVVALSGGIEVPLQQHLESLKQPNTGWEHQFAGSGARGMSASGSTPTSADGKSWSSLTFTEQIAMLNSQPELAAQLQAQG